MKRLVIAIIIFSLTVGLCIWGFASVTKRGEEMINLLTVCANQAENATDTQLEQIAEQINKEWNNRSTLLKSVFIHNDFAEIESLLRKLHFFAKQNSPDSFVECCNEAISRLYYTLDNEKPKIQNIL